MPSTVTVAERQDYDVIVLGAGYCGMMAALRLGRRKLGLRVALVNAENRFVERVRLQEDMIAAVKPRIASLSRYLAGAGIDFICGRVLSLEPEARRVRVETGGAVRELGFTQAVYALGSHVDVDAVPGAADHTFRLDPGDGPRAAAALRRELHALAARPIRVVAVGGGALSVEAAGEVKSTWPRMEVTLVAATRAGDFQSAAVEAVLRRDLAQLGVNLVDNEPVSEIQAGEILTAKGRRLPFDICIWAAGMRAPAIARQAGLACGHQDRVLVGPDLRSISHPAILAAGDSAQPLAPTGAPYRPSALTAAVSGVYAAEQVLAQREGRRLAPFAFSTFAQAVALGRYAGVFLLDSDDRQIGPVLGGRGAQRLRSVLIWLVLYFLRFERRFPGVQSWPGRGRVSQQEAAAAMIYAPIDTIDLAKAKRP